MLSSNYDACVDRISKHDIITRAKHQNQRVLSLDGEYPVRERISLLGYVFRDFLIETYRRLTSIRQG